MSWVFLAGDYAFKLKKPVRYEFLDFTTLAKREFNCREELRLNRRLAPDVYLDVVPLRQAKNGQLTLRAEGRVVEWLVKMKRLPAQRMLDWLIEHRAVEPDAVDAAARCLARFYRSATPVRMPAETVLLRFEAEHERDSKLLRDARFVIDHVAVRAVLAGMKRALSDVRPLIEARAGLKVYVEGQGDLRPEHICLIDQPVIIDCLEFNRDLRILDPFDEIAFLDLECERLGAGWVGQRFLLTCSKLIANPASDALIQFYRAARALLRARLALAHLVEPNPRTPEKWDPRARQYIDLAASSLQRFRMLLAQPTSKHTIEQGRRQR
jgi:aminoglycoside phosphotransferase family enzyme